MHEQEGTILEFLHVVYSFVLQPYFALLQFFKTNLGQVTLLSEKFEEAPGWFLNEFEAGRVVRKFDVTVLYSL